MAKILSQEEIDAKLTPEPLPAADPPIVSPYDFKHPARVNRDQLRALEVLHDHFARLLAATLSGAMRQVVDVDTAFVDQTTYAEFIMSLSNPACTYSFTVGPTTGRMVLDVAMPVVFAAVDRAFGGPGISAGMDPRQLTAIEMGVINRIAKGMIENLEACWEPLQRVVISDVELETNPEFIQATAANEIVVLLAFEVNTAHVKKSLISLCYPFFTLEPLLPRLGQRSWVRRHPAKTEELVRDNRLRLGPMEIPLVAELGRVKVSLSEVEKLRAGDVVRLPARAADPAVVYLGGKPKYWAHPFAEENGELKLQLAGPIPAHEQGRYGTLA
ncbi:MAG: flagellar motor switch protein FliM [Candidatus Latescibacteria bacterium]|nr:flagellar motor switch protein FliM [Candidatus Latescibacterota bacterium]